MTLRIRTRFTGLNKADQDKLISQVSSDPSVVGQCMRVAGKVRDEAEANILSGFSLTASKGRGSQRMFEEELREMLSGLESFPVQYRARKAVRPGTVISVGIVSYGTGVAPVYGSLWEDGSAGISRTERPRLEPLGRAARSVGKGT